MNKSALQLQNLLFWIRYEEENPIVKPELVRYFANEMHRDLDEWHGHIAAHENCGKLYETLIETENLKEIRENELDERKADFAAMLVETIHACTLDVPEIAENLTQEEYDELRYLKFNY